MSGMAHFLAQSNAAAPVAEKGGELSDEVGGGVRVGVRRIRGLNYKMGS